MQFVATARARVSTRLFSLLRPELGKEKRRKELFFSRRIVLNCEHKRESGGRTTWSLCMMRFLFLLYNCSTERVVYICCPLGVSPSLFCHSTCVSHQKNEGEKRKSELSEVVSDDGRRHRYLSMTQFSAFVISMGSANTKGDALSSVCS